MFNTMVEKSDYTCNLLLREKYLKITPKFGKEVAMDVKYSPLNFYYNFLF
jgi:hypothetical protein